MPFFYYRCPECKKIEEVKKPVKACRRCLAQIVKIDRAEFIRATEDGRVQWCNACDTFHN
jgi:hypothetical protein